MKHFDFDVYFNHSADDTYLVQYISQALRDKGMTTFDRSTDTLPERPCDEITENDALDASRMMVHVLTACSIDNANVQDMAARARTTQKPVLVARFDGVEIPADMKAYASIDGDRDNPAQSVAKAIDRVMGEVSSVGHMSF